MKVSGRMVSRKISKLKLKSFLLNSNNKILKLLEIRLIVQLRKKVFIVNSYKKVPKSVVNYHDSCPKGV